MSALKICLVSSEFTPFAKTGGLADVTGALTRHLHDQGHDVRALIPGYGRIEDAGFEFHPVNGLQGMTLQAGKRSFHYSILQTTVPANGMPLYLLQCPELYGRSSIYTNDEDEHLRFLVLSRAAIEMCQRMQFAPDIMHCHDWQTGLLPLYLKSIYQWDGLFKNTRSVLTIHNIGYQGQFPAQRLGDLSLHDAEHLLHQEDLQSGVINFLKTGVIYADLVTTVSPTYAHEILNTDLGMGLNPFLQERSGTVVGILNGVDYEEWDPSTDQLIPSNYSARDIRGKTNCKRQLLKEMGLERVAGRPLVGMVSRLAGQKGFELVERVLPELLEQQALSLVVLGSGEPRYEAALAHMQQRFPGLMSFYRGYNNRLAHWIEAGSDMFLMPSLYEPCGLNQMYSLRYGTVPIVRETGGLADSVDQIDPSNGTGTGILFRHYDDQGLRWAMSSALQFFKNRRLWRKVIANGMAQNFSWDNQVGHYVELFQKLTGKS